jgi:hypothetical protein
MYPDVHSQEDKVAQTVGRNLSFSQKPVKFGCNLLILQNMNALLLTEILYFFEMVSCYMLPRLISNSWTQVIPPNLSLLGS